MSRYGLRCNHCGRYFLRGSLCDCMKMAQIKDGKNRQDVAWCMGAYVRDMIERSKRVAEVVYTGDGQ